MRPEGWTNDYRDKHDKDEGLTFFVFDNLRAEQDASDPVIVYYQTLPEAIGAYRYLSTAKPEWTTALGGSIGSTREIDFIQRRMGVNTLVNDLMAIPEWTDRPDVQQAVTELARQLNVQWQSDRNLLGSPIIVPWAPEMPPLATELQNRTLAPSDKRFAISSIREAFVEGKGWIPLNELLKASRSFGYDNPECPKVTRLAVACESLAGDKSRFGVVDITPHDFGLLKDRYEEAREEPSLDQLKQQAKERAAEKNKDRKIGGLYRPKGRGELER